MSYLTETGNYRVQVLNSDLISSSVFGRRGSGNGQFERPYGVITDSAGRVYVTDTINHCIQVFTAEGKFLRMFVREGAHRGELDWPYSVAVDATTTLQLYPVLLTSILELFIPESDPKFTSVTSVASYTDCLYSQTLYVGLLSPLLLILGLLLYNYNQLVRLNDSAKNNDMIDFPDNYVKYVGTASIHTAFAGYNLSTILHDHL